MIADADRRLVVVSNRLPIQVVQDGDGLSVLPGGGGLVTALAPVLKDRGGVWVGWPGNSDPGAMALCRNYSREAGYLLAPLELSDDLVNGFYNGFSNGVLWPLFHEFELPAVLEPALWEAYKEANARFARAVVQAAGADDFVWVHDYHLLLVAGMVRGLGRSLRMGFFLHIPFPPPDIFLKLPWRSELVDGLLQYDLLGFQTVRDRRNFYEVAKRLHPGTCRNGRGQVVELCLGEKRTLLGSFPISIDYKAFADLAATPACRKQAAELREAFGGRFLLFGADRLDYTKGILQRLRGLESALEDFPDVRGKVSMIQVLVPSREEVPDYQAMKTEIERTVSQINGRFAQPGWTPVHYVYRNMLREELVAYYVAADMALVTPLRDGMNLVAKEYAATNLGAKGVLCLSEFAGAAMELHRHALLVNPFDIRGIARAIERGLNMETFERRRRMRAIRRIVRRHNVFAWVESFLRAAFATRLEDFPLRGDDYWERLFEHHGPPWDV